MQDDQVTFLRSLSIARIPIFKAPVLGKISPLLMISVFSTGMVAFIFGMVNMHWGIPIYAVLIIVFVAIRGKTNPPHKLLMKWLRFHILKKKTKNLNITVALGAPVVQPEKSIVTVPSPILKMAGKMTSVFTGENRFAFNNVVKNKVRRIPRRQNAQKQKTPTNS